MASAILFVSYGGGHAHMVYPVIEALRVSSSPPQVCVLAAPAALGIFRERGLDCLGFSDLLEAGDADAYAWGEELAAEHHNEESGIARLESVAYLGLSFKDLVQRHGEASAREAVRKRGRHAFFPMMALRRVADRVEPDMVVTTNSPRAEAAAIAVAQERRLPNLAMTDLFSGMRHYRLEAEHVTFLNAAAKTGYIAEGLVDPERSEMYITGNPAFDRLLAASCPEDDWLAGYIPGLSAPCVLHADMPAYWDPMRQVSHIRSNAEIIDELDNVYAAVREQGCNHLVRPHPSQPTALYHDWLNNRPGAILARELPLRELLQAVDLVVARSTTVALEALYLGTPLLQLGKSLHRDLPLAASDVAWGIDRWDQLGPEMERALRDGEARTKLRRNFLDAFPQGPAAPAVSSLITDIVHRRSRTRKD